MKAPDYVEPLVGWRVWHVVERGGTIRLRSPLYLVTWPPRRELVAACRPRTEVALALFSSGRFGHPPPDARCGCGIYAARTPTRAVAYMSRHFKPRGQIVHRVLGTASLWGTVVECEQGWRASFAYPNHIFVPVPVRRRRSPLGSLKTPVPALPPDEIVAGLAAYRVPVEIVACDTLRSLAETLSAERLLSEAA